MKIPSIYYIHGWRSAPCTSTPQEGFQNYANAHLRCLLCCGFAKISRVFRADRFATHHWMLILNTSKIFQILIRQVIASNYHHGHPLSQKIKAPMRGMSMRDCPKRPGQWEKRLARGPKLHSGPCCACCASGNKWDTNDLQYPAISWKIGRCANCRNHWHVNIKWY